MKTKNSIAHFNGREQQSLHHAKQIITSQFQPLLIYCFSSRYHATTERHCFASNKNKQTWSFDCGMLVVLPDASIMTVLLKNERQTMKTSYGTVDLRVYTLAFVIQQLKEENFFFAWVQRSAILLYERANSLQLLPAAVNGHTAYREQANRLYAADPDLKNGMEEKLVPVITAPKQHDAMRCFELRIQLFKNEHH